MPHESMEFQNLRNVKKATGRFTSREISKVKIIFLDKSKTPEEADEK